MNPDVLRPGERCASTRNRNFEGRQGRGGRTHLVSPAMAAAAAVAGHFATSASSRLVPCMKPFTQRHGRRAVLDRADVDTDQIIPKQFLKRVERTGFGEFLFYDWRRGAIPDFVLNQPEYRRRADPDRRPELRLRLVARARRLGAAGLGFEAVIAPSFADIFRHELRQERPRPDRAPRRRRSSACTSSAGRR